MADEQDRDIINAAERAQIYLESLRKTSGTKQHVYDHPDTVIRDMLTDLMHYAAARNDGVKKTATEYIDMDKIVEQAKKQYISERERMPTQLPPQPAYVRILDNERHEYYARYLAQKQPAEDQKLDPKLQEQLKNLYDRQREKAAELVDKVEQKLHPDGESRQSLQNRDIDFQQQYQRFGEERDRTIRQFNEANRTKGAAIVSSNPEFIAKVPFTQDPEFIKLQRDIQLRQEQETKALLNKQEQQRIEFGRQPGVTRAQLDDNHRRQVQEREAQSTRHKSEQDRYTREYHDAKVLREQLRENEKRQDLEKGRTR